MKPNLPVVAPRRYNLIEPARQRELLAEFGRSGLTAAAFARQHGIAYSTFLSWRGQKASKATALFAEVEVVGPQSAEPIVVELGPQARMRLSSAQQLELAARLLKQLEGLC